MDATVVKEIEDLRRLTVTGLREKYREVFGEESRSNHKDYLYRRIAWRMQALAEGDLSERARRRAMEIANDADLRIRAPKREDAYKYEPNRTAITKINGQRDPRLPKPGTLLTREFKGHTHVVKVLENGFEYEGIRQKSLSAIATAIAGARWNGFLFFGLTGAKEERNA
ncbi:MAG: DUF2924 domain-containing protein [Acidobacteria bacterium]|nr:DUF2924 domain-containing protein [Acidobacteriota bacterium]